MKMFSQDNRFGYTIVELMVTIVIVSVLAASVGIFFVKLLTLQERDREDAYIREKLSDICGLYADYLSLGKSFSWNLDISNRMTVVKYRMETGGVSFETGVVSRVGRMTSMMNLTNRNVELVVDAYRDGRLMSDLSRSLTGDARLIPLAGDMVEFRITPLSTPTSVVNVEEDSELVGMQTSDAAMGYLEVKARYAVKNEDGEIVTNSVAAGRVVRLWNHE